MSKFREDQSVRWSLFIDVVRAHLGGGGQSYCMTLNETKIH